MCESEMKLDSISSENEFIGIHIGGSATEQTIHAEYINGMYDVCMCLITADWIAHIERI